MVVVILEVTLLVTPGARYKGINMCCLLLIDHMAIWILVGDVFRCVYMFLLCLYFQHHLYLIRVIRIVIVKLCKNSSVRGMQTPYDVLFWMVG